MTNYALFLFTLQISTWTHAFAPNCAPYNPQLQLQMKREDFLKFASASFLLGPMGANAQEVKVMDMSLPSYSSISDPKADLEVLKGKDLASVRREGASSSKRSSGDTGGSSKKSGKAVSEKVDDDRISKLKFVDTDMPRYN